MTTTNQVDPEKKAKHNKNIGRLAAVFSILISGATRLWQAWLFPIVNSLGKQGRLHEGDSDGCFYGFLMVPTVFLVPFFVAVAVVLSLLGFQLKARWIAVIAFILAIFALLSIIPEWMNLFGS